MTKLMGMGVGHPQAGMPAADWRQAVGKHGAGTLTGAICNIRIPHAMCIRNIETPPAEEDVAGEGDGGDAVGEQVEHGALVKGAHCVIG